MNHFLQDHSLIIIAALIFIIFFLMAAMIFILFKLLTMPKSENISTAPIEAKNKKTEPITEKYFCIHHTEAPSVGSCLICEEVFCENCLVEHESMHFCKEHFRIYANHKWCQITDVRTTPDTPEDGLYIYNFKRDIWKDRNIPSFVMTHYKINIDNDFIESFIQLNVIEEDSEKISNELRKYKALD